MDLISSQITHKLMTLLTILETGYKISIHRSVILSSLFVEENQQNVAYTSSSRGPNATKHPFFSRLINYSYYFVHSIGNMVL